ncbi:contractile injection system tape measure protein [Photorhabdus sp. APURE]|uniref:contractile injection system tape measure protein n=1 Tax=Photorhabdus aballayi TaxID=2991723 RepID=UPI00223CD5B3|nr:contractile injection system tape measure protein [Photorhabdus aballayi]MCW7549156.1 contractile injection system tape measure protein [Photorhabdus aballayi]
MPWEPNLLNRIIITIETNNQQVAKKVLHGSLLNQADINKLFNIFFTQHPINQSIYLETLTLDLGEINLHNFNSLFPVKLNTALNKALSQYQINHQEKKTSLIESKSQKITNKSSLLYVNNSINVEDFIHYLNQKNSALNSIEIKTHHQNIDINIRQLVNQLAGIEDKLALFLAKSCLSEPSLQRLLMLKQPTLLSAINYRLSEKINRSQYLGEPVSPGQLILNALQYIQLNHTQEIPKLDAKVLSHLTTELDNGTLNATSIITLFRQIITDNIPLNSWLKQFWQTIAVARFSKKYLSTKEYQYLSELFIENYTDKNRSNIELTPANINISKIQQEKYLPEHSISNHTDKNTLGKELIATHHDNINPLEEPYLPEHFTQKHTNRNQSSKQSVITDINGKITQGNQYIPEHFISAHANKNKSSKKLACTHVDIQNIQQYQYSTNQKLISENHKISSVSNNLSIKDNKCSQFRAIRKVRSESNLLPGKILPYQVNNAGILILWPMLPALFNQFSLLEEQKFIHRQAQFSAVNFLNYLIWGKEEIPRERKMLNNVLCGLMVDEMIQLLPLEPEKQLIIDQWLDAIINQLSGWKKLSRNDVRQLFLQRPGALLINEQEIKITVEHQPFDVLLDDWPWPLNIAKLPWLDHPLKIDWKNI